MPHVRAGEWNGGAAVNVDLQNLGTRWRQVRFNPLRSLTPERLSSALDSFEAGWLREAALIYEAVEKREAIVGAVMRKRRAAVARRDWQIVIPDKDDPDAEAHKATLEYFYNNLSVTDATDLNVRSGMSGLLRQMMDSVIQKYAVHEIVWQPTPEGLTAELRRVPLYFFENRTGRLRFVGPETRADGMPLEPGGWMVTVADGLGEALSICYMFKRMGIQDVMAFSEKFSVPGILGRTTASKDSDEGRAMRDSVLAYASEWVGINYNDDGQVKDPIQVIQTPGGSGAMPGMTIAEYMDRMIACLVSGGDLATISRDNSTGSNPQQDSTDSLLEDDCALVSETLQMQLDRAVIRMVHGDVSPAAYVVVNPPSNQDLKADLAIDQGLKELGVVQAAEDLAERYGRELAEVAVVPVMTPAANDRTNRMDETYAEDLRSALAADMQPLGDALLAAYQAGDFAAMQAALKKISKDMPELAGDADALSEEIAGQLADAFTGGEVQAANSGNSEGNRKGWEARRKNGWLPANRPKGTSHPKKRKERASIEEVLDAAFQDTANRDYVDYDTVTVSQGTALKKDAPFDVTGWKRRVEADAVNKILSKHTTDPFPVTEEDFRKLPELHRNAITQTWEKHKAEWRLKTIARDGRNLWIIEQARTGQDTLNLISMYRP